MTRRRSIMRALVSIVAVALFALPVVALAAPDGPTANQRIDLKVLLLTPNTSDGVFTAWKDTLGKLGVSYDTYDASTSAVITDATLANYATNRAYYQAVIFASSGVALSANERTAVDKLETTFGVREISDNTNPDAGHGATFITGATIPLGSTVNASLTDAGKAAFPYLKGSVPLTGELFAAAGTPTPAFTSLVNAPAGTYAGGSFMGIWKRPNGTEQLVDGIPGNGQQTHYQLMRFGMLNWATRGVYMGYWRNYFEVQVDDLFLGDDSWDTTAHSNNYDPGSASRMTPADLAQALAWSQAHNFRFDFAYNAGGHAQFEGENGVGTDALWNAFRDTPTYRSGFGFINHTYDHAFLGCSSAAFVTQEVNQNVTAGRAIGLPVNANELVTGEHSGLANTRPGNPGVLDPPNFDTVDPSTTTAATLAAGTYNYAVTVSNAAGQTSTPAPVAITVTAPQNSVTARVSMICKGTTYALYRQPVVAGVPGTWAIATTFTQGENTQTDNGSTAALVTLVDTGATLAPTTTPHVDAAPPTADTAVMVPYAMNANFTTGLANAGVNVTATDASKAYPIETSMVPTPVTTLPQNAAGTAFTLPAPGGRLVNTVPRYPTNVYYNASRQSQQLDEYNWIYNSTKGCVASPETTCNTADVSWEQYLASERSIVFGHITGDDPRPHYAHQSNLADYNPLLPETYLDPVTPALSQGGILYPYLGSILDYYRSLYADNAPITQLNSTQISEALTRDQGWAANVAAGRVSGYILDDKMHINTTVAMVVPVTGTMQGDDYAGTKSTWLAVPAGETVLNLKAPIVNPTAPVTVVSPPAAPQPTPVAPPAPVTPEERAKKAPRPTLTNLKMSTRKFAAARQGLAKSRSHSQISWKVNRVSTVRLVIQRKMTVKKGKAIWLTMGTITKKNAKVGTTKLDFTGKIGTRKVAKGSYRVLATATAGGQRSITKTLTFTIIKL